MKPKQANELAQRLKGLVPKMTDEQVLWWAERFERFELAPAEAALKRYPEEDVESDGLRTGLLLMLIREETNRLMPPRPVDQAWLRIRNAIDAMSDDELASHREAVIDAAPEASRAALSKADPRSAPLIMSLIAEHARPAEVAAGAAEVE